METTDYNAVSDGYTSSDNRPRSFDYAQDDAGGRHLPLRGRQYNVAKLP
ncbi:MAG: hypothetical protein IJ404_01275 [Clostridia bacterium]|nr:hypothetical protein [Clostridia bacterium]